MMRFTHSPSARRVAVIVVLAISIASYQAVSAELAIVLDSDELFQGEPLTGYFDVEGDLSATFCNSIRFYGGCLSYELILPDGNAHIIDCKSIDFCIGACGDGFRSCPAGLTIRVPLFLWIKDRQPLLSMPGDHRLQVKIKHDGGVVAGEVAFTVVAHPEYPTLRDDITRLYAEFFLQAFDAPVKVRSREFSPFPPGSPYTEIVQAVAPFFAMSGLGVSHVLNYGTISSDERPYPENAAEFDLARLQDVAARYAIIRAYVERFESARLGLPVSAVESVRYVLSTG